MVFCTFSRVWGKFIDKDEHSGSIPAFKTSRFPALNHSAYEGLHIFVRKVHGHSTLTRAPSRVPPIHGSPIANSGHLPCRRGWGRKFKGRGRATVGLPRTHHLWDCSTAAVGRRTMATVWACCATSASVPVCPGSTYQLKSWLEPCQ